MKKNLFLSMLIIFFALTMVACNDSSVHKLLLQNTVKFDACGGGEVTPSQKTVLKDDCYGELPTPERTGYIFLGWYTQKENGILITSESIVTDVGQETLYAHWKESSYTVSFDLGYEGSEKPSSINVQYLGYYGALPSPKRDGYVFYGWKNENGDDVYSYSISNYAKDHKLTAQWTQNYVVSFVDDKYYTETTDEHIAGDIISDSGTRDAADSIEVTKGESCSLPNLNNTIERVGYKFKGWQEEGGEVLTPASKYTPEKGSTKFKAVWSPNTVYVYLNTMSGTVTTNGIQVSFAKTYGELPTPEKTGFTFAGWYKDSEKITKDSIVKTVASHTLYAAWTPIEYNITYKDKDNADFSGIHGTNYPTTHTYNTATNLVAAQDKAGYKFDGWYTDSTCTDNKITAIGATSYTADITLYAKWKANTYTITYADYGDSKPFSGQFKTSAPGTHTYDTLTTLATPSKTGYIFEGWYYKDSNSTYVKLSDGQLGKTTFTSDMTIYANWTPITYTIKFDSNTGSGSINAMTYAYDEQKSITDNSTGSIYKNGYGFAGWNTKADGSGTHYADSASIKNLTDSNGAEIILYAQWTPITYHVAFDNNTGTGTIATLDIKYDATVNLTLNNNAITKTGYTFAGWNTQADGNGTPYADGASFNNIKSTDETLTLYAQWNANIYTISYKNKGGDDFFGTHGENYPTSHTYDTATQLKPATKTGYDFNGWYDNPSCSGTAITSIGKKDIANDITLYAKWTPIEYSISYELDGGVNALANPSKYTFAQGVTSFYNPTKTGYTFNGWFDAATNGNQITTIANNATGDKTLYAHWTANTYKIVFNSNSGMGEMAEQSFTYNQIKTALTSNAFSKTGYTFDVWNTKDDGTGISYSNSALVQNLSSINNDTITLYAKWKANTYTITYADYGDSKPFTGQFASSAPGTHTYDTLTTLATPSKTGYIFEGWYYKDSNSTYVKLTDGQLGKTTFTSDMTIYANWTPITYTIRFNANGDSTVAATGSIADLVATYDTPINLTKNETSGSNTVIARNYYDFAGWNTQADGNGYSYADEALVKNLANTQGSVINLYAKWTPQSWSITYKDAGDNALSADNADSVIATMPSAYSYGVTLKLQKPTKTGYTHAGWYTDSACSDAKIVTNYDLNGLSGNLVLYAKWTANTYTITYKDKGGSSCSATTNTSPTSHTYGTATTLVNPSKTGYTFGGWYTTSDCTGTAVTSIGGTAYAADFTLYAKWTANTYNITYKDKGGATFSGTHETGYPTTHTYGSTTSLKSPTKTGYTFDGWFTSSDCSGTAVSSIGGTDKTSDFTLYAKWTANTKGSAAVSSSAKRTNNKCGWVQLWEGGPKWAEFNVGATISSYASVTTNTTVNIGGLYSWGGSNERREGSNKADDKYTGNNDLTNTGTTITDTATNKWGSNWKMPTITDLNNLLNNCDWTWCSGATGSQYTTGCTLAGYKVSGKGEYANNSIFLPMSGRTGASTTDTYHGYWSSTADGQYNANIRLWKNNNNVWEKSNITCESRYIGYTIRAILNE